MAVVRSKIPHHRRRRHCLGSSIRLVPQTGEFAPEVRRLFILHLNSDLAEIDSIERYNEKSHQTRKTAPSHCPSAASTPSSPTLTTSSPPQPQHLQQTSPSSTTTPCQSTSPASATTRSFQTKSTSPCKRKRYSIMPRASSPGVARLWKMVKSPLFFCCYLCVLLGIDAVLCKGVVRF
jgi:hypothetical protein